MTGTYPENNIVKLHWEVTKSLRERDKSEREFLKFSDSRVKYLHKCINKASISSFIQFHTTHVCNEISMKFQWNFSPIFLGMKFHFHNSS